MDFTSAIQNNLNGLGEKQVLKFQADWSNDEFSPTTIGEPQDVYGYVASGLSQGVLGYANLYFGYNDPNVTMLYNTGDTLVIGQNIRFRENESMPWNYTEITSVSGATYMTNFSATEEFPMYSSGVFLMEYETFLYTSESTIIVDNYKKIIPFHNKLSFLITSYSISNTVFDTSYHFLLDSEEPYLPLVHSNEDFLCDSLFLSVPVNSELIGVVNIIVLGYFIDYKQLR